ncbi:hypothetical protein OAK75_08535 [Bacteriovoracales bacterium]|nr:hypothetical protein [Bacteriovoracales bacterium]
MEKSLNKFIILFTLPWALFAKEGNLKKWVENQWKNVHQDYRIPVIDAGLSIGPEDQKFLAMDANPMIRNQYINSTYFSLGQKLSKCLSPQFQIGNWYHFATWASLSAGEVISGQKFAELGKIKNALFWIGGAIGKVKGKKVQKEIFANTNAIIATEMIPLGREFLKTFCGDKKGNYAEFQKRFDVEKQYDLWLLKAFKNYEKAIREKDYEKKMELITYGSIFHVVAEQKRVDTLILKIFQTGFRTRLTRTIFKIMATKSAPLRMGTDTKLNIRLDKDVPTNFTHPFLKKINHLQFQHFNKKIGLKNNLRQAPTYKRSKSKDWGNFEQRQKFLAAFFRGYITHRSLFTFPQKTLRSDTLIPEIKQIYKEAAVFAGKRDDMAHRAKALLFLYYETKKTLSFALSISHLTLALDRSTWVGEAMEKKPVIGKAIKKMKYVKDYKVWGGLLRSINQTMVRRLFFSYRLAELLRKKKISFLSVFQGMNQRSSLYKEVDSIAEIIPFMMDILEKVKTGKGLSKKEQWDQFEIFSYWEHRTINQPQMKKGFSRLPAPLKLLLKRPPRRFVEAIFLDPFNVRATFNLKCFKRKRYLRTENFMNPNKRIDQAREFFGLMMELNFNPNMSCFRDNYYLYQFPEKFYRGPKKYIDGFFKKTSLSQGF